MVTVGGRIKTRRAELGWTQDHLAEKAGISKSFVSDVENGKRSIGAETLLDVGRAMSVSLDFLMTGKESGEQQADPQIPASLARFCGGRRFVGAGNPDVAGVSAP